MLRYPTIPPMIDWLISWIKLVLKFGKKFLNKAIAITVKFKLSGIIKFSKFFSQRRPDLIILLGDRFEILAACTAAYFHRIPVAHLHGGESTEGLIDEGIRHSITKMSHIHFVSTKKRSNIIKTPKIQQAL